MTYETRTVILKDSRQAIFRSPLPEDASGMLEYLKACASETHFLLRCPEECVETEEQERAYLQKAIDSPLTLMIVCKSDGEIAGNCQLTLNRRIKTSHRASVGIALRKKYWGLGIGGMMMDEMSRIAKEAGVMQLELDFVEGNERAKALYERSGFRIIAEHPDAIRLKDGTLLSEYSMIKKL